jgi:hypothetical protein
MALQVRIPENIARRWAEETERAAVRAILSGTSHEEISRGLACIRDGAYTLTKRGGTAFSLTLPRDLCELLGAKVGDRFVYYITERGTVELRLASLEDLPEFARAAAARADEILAKNQYRQMLKHFEKVCEKCGHLYCARRSTQRFCPTCGLLRARESHRRHWHRRGKLSPSYARKLKDAQSASTPPGTTDSTHGRDRERQTSFRPG